MRAGNIFFGKSFFVQKKCAITLFDKIYKVNLMTAAMMVGGVFVPAYSSQRTPEEQERIEKEREQRVEKLIGRICKSSPLGKKIVESAIARGISIGIDGDKGNSLGSYIPSMKYVSLNEKASDAKLLSTIVHECRHSEQTPVHDHTYSIYDSVCEVRAMEADAMAHECAAVYQMRKAEPETYGAFCERHGGIMKAYETSFEAQKDPAAAKNEAFKAWYDHAEYVELYDRATVEFMAMGSLHAGAYKKEIPPKKMAENVGYVEPEFFTSARASTVSEKTAKDAAKTERGHIRHALKIFNRSKIKTSADKFFVRAADGTVSAPKQTVAADILLKQKRSAGR